MFQDIFKEAGITKTVGVSNDGFWEAETVFNGQDLLLEVYRTFQPVAWHYRIYEWSLDVEEAPYWKLLKEGDCKYMSDGQRLCLEALQAMGSES